MEQVLINALSSLTNRVNLATGLLHPMDKDSAKEMFNILHLKGVILSDLAIEKWANKNGWQAKYAKELGKLGQRIGDGGRVQIKNKNLLGPDPYSTWSLVNIPLSNIKNV